MSISRTAGRTATVAALAALTITTVTGTSAYAASPGAPAWPTRTCVVDSGAVHFRTPEAAMRYLAKAWNCRDLAAVRHLTNPDSRNQMLAMATPTSRLSFSSCERFGTPGWRTWECTFDDVYPAGTTDTERELHQIFTVKPARGPGFYVAVDTCGG